MSDFPAFETQLQHNVEVAKSRLTLADIDRIRGLASTLDPALLDEPLFRAVSAKVRYEGGLDVIDRCSEIIADPKFTNDQAASAFEFRARLRAKHGVTT